MNKWLKILVGLLLMVGMVVIAYYSTAHDWAIAGKSLNVWHAGWEFLKGGIFWLVMLVGLLLVMLGVSDVKS